MKFLFGGDLYSGSYGNGKTAAPFARGAFEAVLGEVKPLFDQADYSFLNLEAPITENGRPITKTGPNLKNQPEVLKALLYLNATGVMLANNHIMDYGEKGLSDTLARLAETRLKCLGAGRGEDKRKSLRFDGSTKTALLNFAENEWISTPGGTGANPVDFADNFADIRKAKQDADVVIVNVHTGNEFNPVPSPWQKKLCRFYVDAGADVVICHHTHVISGFEYYNGKYIHYGLGNFLFDNARWTSPSLRQGVLLSVEAKAGAIDVQQHMVHLRGDDAKLEVVASPDWSNQLRINELLLDDTKLEAEYRTYMKKTTAQYLSYLQPYSDFLKRFYKKGFLPSLQTRSSKKLLLNLMRCESHREVLIRMLEDQLAKDEIKK